MVLKRLIDLIRRRKRAKKLGFAFSRAASFTIPNYLLINGERKLVNLPQEKGVKIAFVEILLDDCYGLEELSKPILKVLDIGANVGLFSIAARNKFPQAVIHAYEPNPSLKKHLQIQAQTAGFDYFMEAVGLEEGKVSLEFHEDSVQTRSTVNQAGDISQVAFRNTIERLGGSVDLAKVDCEGAEWLLFQDKANWQLVQNLSLEYHLWPDHKHEEVKQVIEDLGFKIKRQIPLENYGLIIAHRL